MLSISRAKDAISGMQYFEADSYYVNKNEQGIWLGKKTESLGLSRGIDRSDFRSVLDGCDSKGNKLVKGALTGKRRSYVDFTFSCPKSVSILSYVDERIEEAHNIAVERAFKEIERNYAIARSGAQGMFQEKTENIIAARFNHHESRELEPQLHSHCVMMNMTQRADGKWRSLEMGEMYKNQLYIGQIYRCELAKEIAKLGYKIDVTERSKGLFEIAGVRKEILEEFSTRRKQIEESKKNYDEYNISEAKKSEMACLSSRKYKYNSDVSEIRKNAQKRLKDYDTTLEQIKDEAMGISTSNFMTIEDEKKSTNVEKIDIKDEKPTIFECIKMALEDVTETQSAFRKEAVVTLALKNGLGLYNSAEIKEAFLRYETLFKLGVKDISIGRTIAPDVEFFTTKEMMKIEKEIVEKATALYGKFSIAIEEEKVRKIIAEKEVLGIQYSAGQKSAIEMMCTSKAFINILQGDAGAGKTFAVETFREIMNDSGYHVRGFAPTAKAAVELQSAKIETSTVDSFLQSKRTQINEGEVWVVDESGMLGSRKLSKFLSLAEEYKAKVILIGDSKQFQAIEQGKMFEDLQSPKMKTGFASITEVRRQKTEYMKEVVNLFKNETPKGVKEAFKVLDQNKKILKIKNRDKRLEMVAKDYLADIDKGINTIVLTATNNDRNDLNKSVRSALIQKGIVQQGHTFATLQNAGLSASKRRFADSYKIGQQIFFQKDSGDIKRGTQAEITGINGEENTLTIKIISAPKFKDSPEESEEKIADVSKKSETTIPCEQKIQLFKEATKLQAFNIVSKNFGVGDKIITLKNDKLLGIENGKIGIVKSVDEDGNLFCNFSRKKLQNFEKILMQSVDKDYFTFTTKYDIEQIPAGTECHIVGKNVSEKSIFVEYEDKNKETKQNKILIKDLEGVSIYRETNVNLNLLKNYSYVDHAYAVTSYKSQGATVDQVRWCHDHTLKTNYNEAYVAITRAKLDAVVYTSDVEKLVEHASVKQVKESVIQWHAVQGKTVKPINEQNSEKKQWNNNRSIDKKNYTNGLNNILEL